MSGVISNLLRRALFCFDPEQAHGLGITGLKTGLLPPFDGGYDARLNMTVAGLKFPNPLGIAAGFDKNAEVPDALMRIGLGFSEVGTVTPAPQSGSSKPRIFRLEEDQAVINRLGFNNEGHEAVLARLKARSAKAGIVGVNIGATKDSADRIGDYVLGIERFYDVASYFTVNISSPNTPGLRDLQARAGLAELLSKVMAARDNLAKASGHVVPVFLKIAPDLVEGDLDDVAAEVLDKKLEGVIVSNTTLSRTGLRSTNKSETGGMSGVPLFEKSTIVLAKMRQRLGRDVAIIGVGGVNSAATALQKIQAGADLVQLYTGFIYGGPTLPKTIINGLSAHLTKTGVKSISELRDTEMAAWAAKSIS